MLQEKHYTLHNDHLTLVVSEMGGEMLSLRTPDGREWLWQAKAPFWRQTAPHLFPFIGKHTQDCYLHEGNRYPSQMHGFLHQSFLQCVSHTQGTLALQLTSTVETRKIYPFDFSLEVFYALKKNSLQVSYKIDNCGDSTMYFSLGGYPGFSLPLDEATVFEDWRVVFPHACQPRRLLISDDCFFTGFSEPYLLLEDTCLALDHDLFHREAVILTGTGNEARLQSAASNRAVVIRYPDMPILALWHTPHTKAPFLCMEPWTAMPARKGIVEELCTQPFLTALGPGQPYAALWEIDIIF